MKNENEDVRKFTHDYPDDTEIRYTVDSEGSHMECSFTSEDPDCGTETILYNASPAVSLKEMSGELLEEITGYLDATDNGNLRMGRNGCEQYYDEFNNSTLYAIEKALTQLAA